MKERSERKKGLTGEPETLSGLIAEAALEKKGEDVKILQLEGLTDITDYFVICSGSGDLHVKAIVDNIKEKVESVSKPWHIEGYGNFKWVLLDYIDVVAHVFDRETREYYDLERLWADAQITEIKDPEE